MRIIDLSVAIEDSLPVDPPAQIARIDYIDHRASVETMLRYFPGATREDLLDSCGWAVEDVKMNTHNGTHLDAPYHYHPTTNGGERAWTIDEVPLEWCIGNGVVFDFSDKADGYILTSKDFQSYLEKTGYTLQKGDIVLIRTNAHEAWGTPQYLMKGCGVGREGTLWLCDQGVRVAGTDAWSWDIPLSLMAKRFEETGTSSVIWEGHKAGADRAYCHLEKLSNLEKLPHTGFTFICFPVKITGAGAGWTRAVAILDFTLY